MTVLHQHHIVPKHDGGTDEPLNLTPPISMRLHAMFHYDRWKALGQGHDLVSCLSLLGQVSGAEAAYLARVVGGRKAGLQGKGRKHPPRPESWSRNIAAANRVRRASVETRVKMSATRRGRPRCPPMTDELRAKISSTLKQRAKPKARPLPVKEFKYSLTRREKISAALKGHPFFTKGTTWQRVAECPHDK